MKKHLSLLLTVVLMGVLSVTASAAPVGVDVPPGYALEIDSCFTGGTSEIRPSFVAGLGDKAAVGVMYDTYLKNFTVCGRYQIVKNLSAGLFFTVDGSNSWAADLRGKYFFNQSLALAGLGKYSCNGMFSGSSIIGQAEYYFNGHWMGNAGLMYTDSPMGPNTSLILGAGSGIGYWEFGVNLLAPADDLARPVIEVALEYLIGK